MLTRASRSGTYCLSKKTIVSWLTSACIGVPSLNQFPSLRQRLPVDGEPSRVLHHALERARNVIRREKSRGLEQRAQHDHVGGPRIAQLVGQLRKRMHGEPQVRPRAAVRQRRPVVEN